MLRSKITIDIYKRVPVLWRDHPNENLWGLSFMAMFHMANDSGLFRTHDQLESDAWTLTGNVFVREDQQMLPLYEAKLIHHFDHRLACYSKRPEGSQDTELPRLDHDEKADPGRVPIPRYWLPEQEIEKRLDGRWSHGWLLGWRDICRSTDERTMICSVIPRAATGGTPLAFAQHDPELLAPIWSSFVLDYVVRQKVTGTHITQFVLKQLPVHPPSTYHSPVTWLEDAVPANWIRGRVLELTYTTYDLTPFAVDLGDDGGPFRWDEERRFRIRAELDAAFFHLYGIERDDVDYIMETFSIVKRKDEQRYGSFVTKELILDVYDAMTEAEQTGLPYQTILVPPPGHGPRHPKQDVLRGDDLG